MNASPKFALAALTAMFIVTNAHAMRWYSPNTGRWLSRDPIGENGGLNLYGFIGNRPTLDVDALGLCKVYSSGNRMRVSIASLDAQQIGTPYADMAKFVQGRLNDEYQMFRIIFPAFVSTGPFTRQNDAFEAGGVQIQGGTFTAGHYLFFVDWEISETKDEPCILRQSESITLTRGNGPPIVRREPPVTPPIGEAWTKAGRQHPFNGCNKTLIYVDAPGSAAITKAYAGEQPIGFNETVTMKLEVLNGKNNAVVDTVNLTVTVGVDANGNLTASP